MAKAFLKRLVLWLVLSLPVGIAAGALVSLYFGERAELDSFTAMANGGLTGAWLGLLGGVGAAATTAISRDRLREAGGSECITGAVVSYGLIAIALVILAALG